MGDLYWLSLANSLMDYDWCNLLKRNCFWCEVTILSPECYTLEVKLRTIDTVYNTNTAQLWEPGLCNPSWVDGYSEDSVSEAPIYVQSTSTHDHAITFSNEPLNGPRLILMAKGQFQ